MNYREALAWLFGTQRFGIKLGLDNICRLLGELRVPSPSQRIIHVAGTNGKGSVCAMIDSILRAGGYRAGLFTSPHLVTFRERIQVNGEMIGETEVAEGLGLIREMVKAWDPHPTFFELATALGLGHFQKQECEIIVLETGMGGRLDATNAVTPVVSVITPIDYDHQKWLGNTLALIAAEKAGIIKPGIPVVSAPQPEEAQEVIRARATDCDAPLRIVSTTSETSEIALAGAHQKRNAAVALAALQAANISVDADAIQRGLTNVRWPARFQRWNERTIIDGAHNHAGAGVLTRTWREIFGATRAVVILAVLREKDAAGIVAALAPIASEFLLPHARAERALSPEELLMVTRSIAPDTLATVVLSLEVALSVGGKKSAPVLITGSLHFAGEALAVLGGHPDELEDCLQ